MTALIASQARPTPSHMRPAAMPAPVDVLICGSIDRGDDAAPFLAADVVEDELPTSLRVRRIGQLDVDDLLSVRPGAGVVIVDAATGLEPGEILEIPLRGLFDVTSDVRSRSSHALAMPEVIGLAGMLRGRPLVGRIVVIGARSFRLGRPLSRRVRAAIPALARAIVVAAAHVTESLRDERLVTARARRR